MSPLLCRQKNVAVAKLSARARMVKILERMETGIFQCIMKERPRGDRVWVWRASAPSRIRVACRGGRCGARGVVCPGLGEGQKQKSSLSRLLHQVILMMQAAKHRGLHNVVTRGQLVSVVAGRNTILVGLRNSRT